MKGWMLAALAMMFLLAGCTEEDHNGQAADETVSLGESKLVLSQNLSLQNKTESSLSSFYKDTLYTYNWEDRGQLKIKVRTVNNGDQFVMVQLENISAKPLALKAKVIQPKADDYYFIDWHQKTKPRQPDPVIGNDVTTPPSGLLRYSADNRFLYEAVVSKQYQSKGKTKLYGNGQQSTIRELTAEKESLQHDVSGFSFLLEAPPGQLTEQWFLLAKEPLFENGDHLSSWISFQYAYYQEVNNWFTVNGAIKKLPWSIEPFTKSGYGRHLGMLLEKAAIDQYFSSGDRYFYDLMAQSIGNLLEYREQKRSSVWKNEYTNAWLKRKYHLAAPYVDTQQNEVIVLYLYRIGKEFDDKDLMSLLPAYADYLLDLIEIDMIVPTAKGYLPADYYSPYQRKRFIHSSLPSAISKADLFIEAYKATGKKKYAAAARDIQLGIESLGTKWIRPDGELWHQVKHDLTFSGKDTGRLTLDLLEQHQKNWQSMDRNKSPVLQKLIDSKRKAIQR